VNYYIHNLDPFFWRITRNFGVRWYGLAYLAGFLVAWLLLRRLSRRGEFPVPVGELENFILWIALAGVMAGGRIGYALFYARDLLFSDPLFLLRIWEGGMASHGGILGVIAVLAVYARRHRVGFWELTDGMALVAPAGLFFGRLANFINGELWGRVTRVPWAVIFPQEAGLGPDASRGRVLELVQAGLLHPRHPSQLYEALGEGLLLFGLLWLFRRAPACLRPGFTSAAFLILYAVARIGSECFREPDSALVMGLSKGQFFSLFMLAGGLWLLLRKRASLSSSRSR